MRWHARGMPKESSVAIRRGEGERNESRNGWRPSVFSCAFVVRSRWIGRLYPHSRRRVHSIAEWSAAVLQWVIVETEAVDLLG
jgi:hypothetical protein